MTRQPLWKVTTGLRRCSQNLRLLNSDRLIQLANENASAASDALKKALAIKPDYLDAQLAQVALESHQGNYEKAMAISHQIQKQQKKSPVGYIAEGDLLMAQQKPALAVKAYEHAFDISKSGPAMMKIHASLSQAGKIPEANSRWFNG